MYYKISRVISHLAGLFGCITAIYLLCNEYPSTEVTLDYQGVIIGILALLVTLLVAWNIYNAIGVEQRVTKALSKQEKHDIEKDRAFNDLKNEVKSMIADYQASTSEQINQIKERAESAEQAYIMLFNAIQGQVSALDGAKDYLQRYMHYQTALLALLQCKHFPSDIRHNIPVLLEMMENAIDTRAKDIENHLTVNDIISEEDKKEFIQDMEKISRSTRTDFSFEDRRRFLLVAEKVMTILEKKSLDS